MSEEEKKTVVTKMGKVERAEFSLGENDANNSNEEDIDDKDDKGDGAGADTPEAKAAKLTADYAAKFPDLKGDALEAKIKEEEGKKPPALNEDQLRAIFKEQFGEDFNGNIEDLKNKVKPAAAIPTDEEKAKIEKQWDERQLQVYLDAGGTIEKYAALKAVAAMDLTDLSNAEIRKELRASSAKFNEAEIEGIIKERYYQLNPDELEKEDGETDPAFEERKAAIKKRVDYGAEKFASRGAQIKKQAETTLKNLRQAIIDSDAQKTESAKQDAQISSTVDEVISKMPKKVVYELGKVNDADVSPVETDVDAQDLIDVAKILKDPTARNNIFKNQDGSINVKAIADLLLENKNLKKLVKVGYIQGGTRQVEAFRLKFPFISATDLGLGSNGSILKSAGKSAIASSGKVERVKT